MQFVISASCSLYILQHTALLEASLHLPDSIAIPDILLEEKLSKFTVEKLLGINRLKIINFNGDKVKEAIILNQKHPYLSQFECFSLIYSINNRETKLISENTRFHKVVASKKIKHGTALCIVNAIEDANIMPEKEIDKVRRWINSNQNI